MPGMNLNPGNALFLSVMQLYCCESGYTDPGTPLNPDSDPHHYQLRPVHEYIFESYNANSQKMANSFEKLLINIVKNNIRQLFASEPHQVVKITVP